MLNTNDLTNRRNAIVRFEIKIKFVLRKSYESILNMKCKLY